jgi:hypothetical protein
MQLDTSKNCCGEGVVGQVVKASGSRADTFNTSTRVLATEVGVELP